MNIQVPDYVAEAIDALASHGYEAYAVGGCIRDIQLGIEPTDWDITTCARPEEMMDVFKNKRVIPTGIEHGTVTVIISDHHIEITTFRIDGNYLDNRHPDEVTFTSLLSEDLKRRDFTINTLAFNNTVGLVDQFGGLEDIENKIIRCVGDPDTRFKEDALRIMRALRFASVLSFKIDEDTKKSILKNANLLKNVSAERISNELLKLLCGENVTQVLIEYRDVIGIVIPEITKTFDFDQKNKHHIYNIYDHMAYSVGYSVPEPDIRLALLLHDIGKPKCYFTDDNGVGHFYGHGKAGAEIVAPILRRLKLTNEMCDTVTELVLNHDCPIAPEKKYVKRRLSKFGEPLLRKLMKVKVGDSLAHNPKYGKATEEINEINSIIDEVINRNECFSLKTLNITGTDLINLGARRGPNVGKLLSTLLSEVVDGKLENTTEALTIRAKVLL